MQHHSNSTQRRSNIRRSQDLYHSSIPHSRGLCHSSILYSQGPCLNSTPSNVLSSHALCRVQWRPRIRIRPLTIRMIIIVSNMSGPSKRVALFFPARPG